MKNNIYVFFCLCTQLCFAQDFPKSYYSNPENTAVILDSIDTWIETDYLKKAQLNINSLESELDENVHLATVARLNMLKSGLNIYLSNLDKAEELINKSEEYYASVNDSTNLIYIYNVKGIIVQNKKNDAEAIKYYNKALSFLNDTNSESIFRALDVYINLIYINFINEQWEECLDQCKTALGFAKAFSMPTRKIKLNYYAGKASFQLRHIEESKQFFGESERLFKAYINKNDARVNSTMYPYYLIGLTEVYEYEKEYQKVIDYLKISREQQKVYLAQYKDAISLSKYLSVEKKKIARLEAEGEFKQTEVYFLTVGIILAGLLIAALMRIITLQKRNQKIIVKTNIELNDANEKVKIALESKTNFLNNITHEIKTPLYALSNISKLLNRDIYTDEQKEHIEIITLSANFLHSFMDNIFENKVGNDTLDLALDETRIDIKQFIASLEKGLYFSDIEPNKNEYIFTIDQSIPSDLLIDPTRLARILFNLLHNASTHSKNGKITTSLTLVSDTKNEARIKFIIADTGTGISQTQLAYIKQAFDNNEQVIKREKDSLGGLGIGLINVQNILKLYNSELKVQTAENVGTECSFEISFSKMEPIKIETETREILEKNKKILLVEDNTINQIVTKKILEKEKYQCDIVDNGLKAVYAVGQNDYDVILMDIMMPIMDGFEASKIIKEKNPQQKIIAFTGYFN